MPLKPFRPERQWGWNSLTKYIYPVKESRVKYFYALVRLPK